MAEGLILVPFVAILALNLLPRSCRLAFGIGVALAVAQAAGVMFRPALLMSGHWFPLAGDNLSRVMVLSISLASLASFFVVSSMVPDNKKRFLVYNVLLLAVAGMNGIVLVSDLFSLYVFIELAAVSSFVLIASELDRDGLEGAFKYLVISAVATVMMLSAVSLLFLATGATSFASAKVAVSGIRSPWMLLAVVLFLTGLMIKSGVVPFHGWVPDVYMSAPAGVSVLLAGIVTKTTGVYALVRLVLDVFGFTETVKTICLVLGLLSIFVGALAALRQSDFKRMLAYSSISQIGYIVLGLGAGTPLGVAGAIFHLFNHTVFKSLLFVNAAAVERQTGTRDMDRLGGLSARMPLTGTSSVIALLSTAGVPPLAGFWSKLAIVVALWQVGREGYALAAIMGSLLTLAYFLSMQRRVFFGLLKPELAQVREVSLALAVPTLVLTLITVGVGILIPLVFGTFVLPVPGL